MKTRQCFSLLRTFQMLLILALMPAFATAQDAYFYTFEGERIMLDKAADQIVVKIAQLEERAAVESELQTLIPDIELKPVKGINSDSFFIIRSQNDISTTLIQLKDRPQFEIVQPVYLLNDSPLIAYDVFKIKLQNDAEFNRMLALNERYGVELVSRNAQLPNLITLKMRDFTEFTVLELAQQYFHELNLKYSTPSFIREMERHGSVLDPYFTYQFYMHMISAELAWQITKASSNITVAVLDDGVMAHEDLPGSRIVNGYDAFNPINGDGSPGGNEAHGMASAGIIAASHNEIGIAGLAPNVKVMPVRIFNHKGVGTSPENLETAFSHAVTHGAEVISSSWAFPAVSDPDEFPEITNIITGAMQNGRGGLGTVVVFSAGNNGNLSDPTVRYPATIPGVLSVGAVNENDVQFGYSAEGSQLDIVAPSGLLADEIWGPCGVGVNRSYERFGTVWSLDHDGQTGWNPGNYNIDPPDCYNEYIWSSHSGQSTPSQPYTAHYGGTSASAPQISGVSALMLSINPSLTLNQVRDILHNTADKVPGMGGQNFTNEYGHGRLNAYEAVKHAMPKSNNHSFASSQTLSNALFISGSSTIASGATITVAEGTALIIEGSVNTSGTSSTIHVEGLLDIEESANISNVNIDVGANGMVIIREGASISNGDIDVSTFGELKINQGATLSFGSGQGISSYGTVSVSGSQASPVVLEASGSSYWDGVYMYGKGVGSSMFNHLQIDGAVNGLGIYTSNGVGISNTEITGSQFHGMHLSSSNNVLMSDLNISQNGSVGIYVDGGDANISHGTIHDNGWEGVYANGGSFVQGPDVMSLEDNVSSSLRLGGSSYMQLAFSSITSSVAGNYHALAINNSTLQATDNWWGAAPPDANRFNELSGSTIDYSMWLWFSPVMYNLNPSSSELAATEAESSAREKTTSPAEMSPDNLGMVRAMLKATSPDNRQQGVDQLRERMPVSQRPWLNILEIEHFQQSGSYEQAQNLARKLMADQSLSSSLRVTAARRLFTQQLIGQHNPDEAGNTLEWITAITPEEDRTRLEWMSTLVEIYSNTTEKPALAFVEEKDSNASDLVVSNYPNPFNPTTNIRYQITEEGPVVLVVYDMLGREIATLVNEVKQAGEYNAQFDAGSLSSGIYLYRLQAGNTVITRQMTLIK